ncbi:MAG: folate family ECF transporter S component [Pseudoflavonifractor sp.]
MSIYKHPFSRAYWKDALADFRKLRTLAFAALMVAACVALAQIPAIPIGEGVRVTWGFLARSVCALVGGPVTALVFGFVEDTLSFFLHPTGPYFPGYTLTTMLGTLIYALFLYRARVTVLRVFLAKLTTNVMNVLLGSLWSAILYSKGYLYYFTTSLVKNTVMLPIQTIMLVLLFGAMIPILSKSGFLPNQCGKRLQLR